MKRFLRYLLLAVLILLVTAWGCSLLRFYFIFLPSGNNQLVRIQLAFGAIAISRNVEQGPIEQFVIQVLDYRLPEKPSEYGFFMPRLFYEKNTASGIVLPIWTVLVPMLIFGFGVWYHPFKAWWRGTNRKGFEVEMKDKVSADCE